MKLFKPVSEFRSLPIFLLIILDQITKLIFSSRDFFIGPVHFHLVKNYGLAFSLNFGILANIILITLGLILFIYYFSQHRTELGVRGRIALVLILAGAIANIIDRLYLGYVRDFLDLGLGFTINLADAFVAAGVLVILIHQSKVKGREF